jgi:hypothetical protein
MLPQGAESRCRSSTPNSRPQYDSYENSDRNNSDGVTGERQSILSTRQINRSIMDPGGVSSSRIRLGDGRPSLSVVMDQIHGRDHERERHDADGQ